MPYATGRAETVVGEYDEFIRRMIDQINRSKEQVRAYSRIHVCIYVYICVGVGVYTSVAWLVCSCVGEVDTPPIPASIHPSIDPPNPKT